MSVLSDVLKRKASLKKDGLELASVVLDYKELNTLKCFEIERGVLDQPPIFYIGHFYGVPTYAPAERRKGTTEDRRS